MFKSTIPTTASYCDVKVMDLKALSDLFLIFPRKQDLTFHANGDNCMRCHPVFWEHKNRSISICCLLKLLPRVLSVNLHPTLPASVAQLNARPTGVQEVAGSTPAEVGNILSWRLIMKYFLRSFSPFR